MASNSYTEKEWITAAGLRARVVIVEAGGGLMWRNGYVAVPAGHPLFGQFHNGVYDIEVHGGLTFSDEVDGLDWWFGFDCMHCTDSYLGRREDVAEPLRAVFDCMAMGLGPTLPSVARTLEFCVGECEAMALQLAARAVEVKP